MSQEYSPGTVNIGEYEIRHRRLNQGYGGMVLAIALIVILYFFNFSFFLYLLLFVPVYISFMGFYQARQKFCINYGRSGVCNVSGQVGETRDVIGRLNRNKDAQKANKMIIISILISAVITLSLAGLVSK